MTARAADVYASMTEAALDRHIERIRSDLGVALSYHTYRSVKSPSGFPDRVYASPGGVLFRELKTAKGRPTAAQTAWLDGLRAAGVDADVWRPEDLASGRIARELAAIARPTRPTPKEDR